MQSMSMRTYTITDYLMIFMNKRISEFWKSWASKFHQNVTKDVYINGSNSELVAPNAFADHFSSIYSTSYNDLDAKRDFIVNVYQKA